MPYKSDAQRRFFHAAEARGAIKKSTVEEFDKASKGKSLPEKVKAMYEGGEVSPEEYSEFSARYELSNGKESLEGQEEPSMSGNAAEYQSENPKQQYQGSPMPSEGYDRDATEQAGDDYNEYPQQEEEDERKRRFA